MKLCTSMKIKTVWQYIVFNYNTNNIEECRKISKDIGVTFRTILSPRWEGDMKKYMPKNEQNYITRNFYYGETS